MLIDSETVLTAFSALREEYQARLPKGSSWYNALQSILNWFDPNGYEMGWNEDIPIDCIYMRW